MVPLFFLVFIFFLDDLYLISRVSGNFLGLTFAFFIISGAFFSFELKINMNWPHNSRVKEMLLYMHKDDNEKLLAATFVYIPSIQYYTEKLGFRHIKTVSVNSPEEAGRNFDFLLYPDQEKIKQNFLKKYELKGWKNTQTFFFENTDFDIDKCRQINTGEDFDKEQKSMIIDYPPLPFYQGRKKLAYKIYHGHDFTDEIKFVIDSAAASSSAILISYRVNLISKNDNPSAQLATERKRKGQSILWNGLPLGIFEIQKNVWKEVESNFLFANDLQKDDTLKVRFFYSDKDTLWIDNTKMNVRIYGK